jgi:hypothetical protein
MSRQIDGGDIQFSFTGDTSDLNESLQRTGNNLENLVATSQGAANQLDRDLGSAADSADDLSNSFDNLGDVAGDVDSILSGLSGGLEMFDELAGTDFSEVAGTAIELAAGIESVSRAISMASPQMMGITAAALALAVAYKYVIDKTEAAEEEQKKLAEANKKLIETLDELLLKEEALSNRLKISSGDLSQRDADLEASEKLIREKYAPQIEELNLLHDEQTKRHQQLHQSGGKLWDSQRKGAISTNAARIAAEKSGKSLEDLKSRVDSLVAGEQLLINSTYDRAEAQIAATTAAEEKAEQDRKDNEDRSRWAAARQAEAAAEKALIGQADAARLATLPTREKLRAEMLKKIEILETTFDATTKGSEQEIAAIQAATDIREKYDADLTALDEVDKKRDEEADARSEAAQEKEFARLAKLRDENERTAIKIAADYEKMKSSVRSSLMELFDAFDAGFSALLGNEKLQEEHANFLRVVFALQKAAALANIALKVQEGLAVAASLPPPADAIKAAAVWTTGGITAATVLATPAPFHSGGIVSAPDEVDIRAQTGEGVVNRTGMDSIGPDGLAAINRGQSAQQVQVQMVFRHKIFDEFVVSNLKRSNSPLRNAIRTGGVSRGLLV